ncbi:MAG TPA: hypothetical protein VGN01_17785 [Acidobacteriaceae bacterium]
MRNPCFLTVPLLLSMCVAPGMAQSPQNHAPPALANPFGTMPLAGRQIAPMQFPGALPQAKAGVAPLRTPKRWSLFGSSHNGDALVFPQGKITMANPRSTTAQNEVCYAMRGYRFSQVSPGSDATQLSDSSTCQPASQVHSRAIR